MQILREMEIGVMFWAGDDPRATLGQYTSMGIRCGQLLIPGDYALAGTAAGWKRALEDEKFTLVTVFAAYNGESYADIPTVERTVGFIPPATRVEREARTKEVSDFAAALGVPGIAMHVGFVPEDERAEDYIAVREIVRRVADHAARHGQSYALETGQERAEALQGFLLEVNRPNVYINFDPANMILYGTGDPIEALQVLAPHVISVHCKDAEWPDKKAPGRPLGREVPLGQGAVGIPRYIAKLREIGYKGPLSIEREGSAGEERLRDIKAGAELLRKLMAAG